jgi:hypothetical protein
MLNLLKLKINKLKINKLKINIIHITRYDLKKGNLNFQKCIKRMMYKTRIPIYLTINFTSSYIMYKNCLSILKSL